MNSICLICNWNRYFLFVGIDFVEDWSSENPLILQVLIIMLLISSVSQWFIVKISIGSFGL